jgi:hypothetical protein
MSGTLSKDVCEKYNSKFVYIPNISPEISKILTDKCTCSRKTKVLNRVTKTGKIVNTNDLFTVYDKYSEIYTGSSLFAPILINTHHFTNETDFSLYHNEANIKFGDKTSNCNICDNMFVSGWSRNATTPETIRLKYTSGFYHPMQDETFLIYKNFMILFNAHGYMPNHLMLVASNHAFGKIKGSQYEILNREFLEDVVFFYSQISNNYIMGHNYAFTGSQTHFHTHIFLRDPNGHYGYDTFIDSVANDIPIQIAAVTMPNTITKTNNIGTLDEYTYTAYHCVSNIYFSHFKCKEYGYAGYLLSMPKNLVNNAEFETYITILFKILNRIENDVIYTFTLYFSPSPTNLNIVIQPQRKRIGADIGAQSFRNISGFAFSSSQPIRDNRVTYKHYCTFLKGMINKHLIDNIFTKEEIFELLEPSLHLTENIFANTNFRHLLTFESGGEGYVISDFIKSISTKPSSDKPKLIVVSAPIGSGKSILKRNLKKYFKFYDEKTFVHINVDDIMTNIPLYKKQIDEISSFLKTNFLNKKFTEYTNVSLHKYGDKTILDLKDNSLMAVLDVIDYYRIYHEIFEAVYPFTFGKTLYVYSSDIFTNISMYREIIYDHMIKLCVGNSLNVIIEVARRPRSWIQQIFGTVYNDNTYYIGYNIDESDAIIEKFILRNVLIRNIDEGRILSPTQVMDDSLYLHRGIMDTYRVALPSERFISLSIGYKIEPKPLNDAHIGSIQYTIFDRFNEDYPRDLKCLDRNIDHDEKIESVALSNSYGTYTMSCFNKNKMDIDGDNTGNIALKSMMTGLNNEFLLDENVMTILIYNTIKNVEHIIQKLIEYDNRIEHDLDSAAPDLDETDIKIILKGGLNIRLVSNAILSHFQKNINFGDDANEEKMKLKSFLNQLDNASDADLDNPFKNTTKKTDIDFIVIINKNKVSETRYTRLQDRLVVLIGEYLIELKKTMAQTNFFGMHYNYKNMKYDKSVIVSSQLKERKSFVACSTGDVHFKSDLGELVEENNKRLTIYPFDKLINNDTITPDIYYVLYIKNLMLGTMKFTNDDGIIKYTRTTKRLDVLRLKNNYYVKTVKTPDIHQNIGGELIDVVVLGYEMANNEHFNDTYAFTYANNLMEFNFNVYGLDYLIDDLEYILFVENLYPWIDKKYQKRLNRYILLILYRAILNISTDPSLYDGYLRDFSMEFSNVIQERISDDSLFAKLIGNYGVLDHKINCIRTKIPEYKSYLETYGFKNEFMDVDADRELHLQGTIEQFTKFMENVANGMRYAKNILVLLKKFLNDDISSSLQKDFGEKKMAVVQWGGYKDLYTSYKKHYFNLKGGEIRFKMIGPNNYELLKNGLSLDQSKYYTKNQYDYINKFMNDVMTSVTVNDIPFNLMDINGATVMGAGSFGASVKITNSGARRSFVIKILGGKLVNYVAQFPEFMMETYMGYYITQHKLKNFNKVYSYFKTSSINSDVYFSSIDPTIRYVGTINNNDAIVKKGDILIIIIDAGDGSLSSFIEDAKTNNPDKVKVINAMDNINKQMLNISKISICSKVSKECIYVTHNDVKPDNMIFRKTGVSPNITYNMEFIDYGGLLFSDSFFTPIKIHTPIFISLVYDNNRRTWANDPLTIASPLYDIGSVVFSMLIMIYDDYDAPDRSVQTLKGLYAGPLNLADITTAYQTLQTELYTKIQTMLSGTGVIPYIIRAEIEKYVKKLLHYVNLMLCINRFMYNHDAEFRADIPNKYKNIDFVNFELMDLKNDQTSVIPLGYKSFDGLRNLELLDRIIVEVERNVAMT